MLFAYREVPQESTGFAPFELLYGRTIRGPMQILRELWTEKEVEDEVKNSYQYVIDLKERLEQTLDIAHQNLRQAQTKYKRLYDRRAKVRNLKEGDEALVLLPTNYNKLLMQWKGPFKVIGVQGKNDYRINVRGKVRTYHVNLLKKFIRREMGKQGKDGSKGDANDQNDDHGQEDDTEDERDQGKIEAGGVWQRTSNLLDIVGAAVIEYEEDEGVIDEEELLTLGQVDSKEDVTNVEIGEELTHRQEEEIRHVLEEFQEVFTDIPGETRLIEHKIEMTEEGPVKAKQYPVPYNMRESLKKDVEQMKNMGVIRESESPYSAPVVIVRKKDGSNRVCIDFRQLNRATVFDNEPMIKPQDIFAKIDKARYYSKFDMTKGYWQIPMRQEDQQKTAFVTPEGCYEFLRMPFGLMNSGATFTRMMRRLTEGMRGIEHYIDDCLIYSETWEEHLETVREFLHRVRKAKLTVRPSKCQVAVGSVEFVGHEVKRGEIGLQDGNVDKVIRAPRPQTKTQVRSFLGLTGFYREYIPGYSGIAVPLTDLTKKGKPNKVEWGQSQEEAFQMLKRKIAAKPVLRLPDLSKPFVLRTDASDLGIGAVLLQEHSGVLFPVAYASKKLLAREKAYSTMEKECLAIVWAVRKFRVYLYGAPFVLQTDHQPLAYLNRANFTNDRITRWALFLQPFQITIQAIKGSQNVGADYLSRVQW